MTLDAWLTLVILIAILGLLSFTKVAADLVFAGGLTLLLFLGVLNPQEALVGFANEGVATVGALYIVVTGLRETGGIAWLSRKLLRQPSSLMDAQLKVMLPVALMSAFLNNTPVVAMLIPAVGDWSKKFRLSASKLMIPLSYAAILGGTCTLIGTSTNLVVNGFLLKERPEDALGMFDLVWVGLPTMLISIAFILVFSRWLLPDRRSVVSQLSDPKEYSIEMLVDAAGPLVGQSIEEAGLRHLQHLFLIEIERKGKILAAVSPTEVLQAGDRLVFVGVVDSVLELQRIRGLSPATDQVFKLEAPRSSRVLIEAVISHTSPLIDTSVRENRFRSAYDAVVIAVARNGERIKQKIGDIILKAGDTLLLEAKPNFVETHRNSNNFYLVSALQDSSPPRFDRIFIALGILIAMVLVVSFNLLSMLEASFLAALLMLASRTCSADVARRSIDWQVLIVIASAFGIGNALQLSGAASVIANSFTRLGGESAYINLLIIYVVTALFSSVITNNAAAVLMFPIALSISQDLNVSVLPFAVAIMMAASASFATPIGYQTNLMVMGPGGYKFADYLKIGLPLNFITAMSALIVIPLVWGF
ncbi:MAG: SLC13 family permease [Trueperaceae bacterium]|nr:SLC13 family permease [Trueperaceae bacterium]